MALRSMSKSKSSKSISVKQSIILKEHRDREKLLRRSGKRCRIISLLNSLEVYQHISRQGKYAWNIFHSVIDARTEVSTWIIRLVEITHPERITWSTKAFRTSYPVHHAFPSTNPCGVPESWQTCTCESGYFLSGPCENQQYCMLIRNVHCIWVEIE